MTLTQFVEKNRSKLEDYIRRHEVACPDTFSTMELEERVRTNRRLRYLARAEGVKYF